VNRGLKASPGRPQFHGLDPLRTRGGALIDPSSEALEIASERRRSWISTQHTPWEFEQIQFAVCHTMSLAGELEEAFRKEFEEEART
jgi:hypothetical protein